MKDAATEIEVHVTSLACPQPRPSDIKQSSQVVPCGRLYTGQHYITASHAHTHCGTRVGSTLITSIYNSWDGPWELEGFDGR